MITVDLLRLLVTDVLATACTFTFAWEWSNSDLWFLPYQGVVPFIIVVRTVSDRNRDAWGDLMWVGMPYYLVLCFTLFAFPDAAVHLPLDRFLVFVLPELLHPFIHFLLTTIPQATFAWGLYPASCVMMFYFCFLGFLILVLSVSLVIFEAASYAWIVLIPFALVHRGYLEVRANMDPAGSRFECSRRTSRTLVDLAKQLYAANEDITELTNEVDCVFNSLANSGWGAEAFDLKDALFVLGHAWSALHPLSAERRDRLERVWRRCWQTECRSSGKTFKCVVRLLKQRLEGPAEDSEGFVKDTLESLDEMLGIVINYALPLPSLKHLSRPFRLQPFFLLLGPPPISRRLYALARYCGRASSLFKRRREEPVDVDEGLELDLCLAIRDYVEKQSRVGWRGASIVRAHLDVLDKTVQVSKTEEDLHFEIVRLLFSRQQRKVFVDQQRLK